MGYVRETKEAGYSLFTWGFMEGRDTTRFGLGKWGWVQSLALLCSQHSEGREATVAVGRICHHYGPLSSAASLLP